MLPSTLQFFVVLFACSLNERMQKLLDYKTEEVLVLKQILREVSGKDRIDFTEAQRARLAAAGKALTAQERRLFCEVVRPKTILDWFRRIYSAKDDSSKVPRRKGRAPPKPKEVRDLVVRLATENASWGYSKIRDAVNNGLQIDIARNTVANMLRTAGIVPAPEREKKRTWNQFLRAHLHCLYACDFFTVEVLGLFGAVRYSVLFVMRLETREVHIAGIAHNPHSRWMSQIARNLTDVDDGFLRDARYLIHDADPLFTKDFKALLESADTSAGQGTTCVQIPPRSPNCNAFAERFVRSIKNECLQHFVFFGQRHLRYVVREYVTFYNSERFHQGLDGALIRPPSANDNAATGSVKRRARLGGLLNFYYRDAA